MNNITISIENPNSTEACLLIDELSETLQSITGSSGRNSFDLKDINNPRALFAVARNERGEAIGCGAIRPINEHIAEIKRMYAKYKSTGIGSRLLFFLEERSMRLGYTVIWLETRLVNEQAVAFYEKHGYHRIPNYGKYKNNSEAACFEKFL